MPANNVVDVLGALKPCTRHISIERTLGVVLMMNMAAFRLCGPARTVERKDLFTPSLHEFIFVVIEQTPEAIEGDVLQRLHGNGVGTFKLTPCVEDFQLNEVCDAFAFG